MKQLFALGTILLLFGLLWTVSAQEHEEAHSEEEHAALVARGREVFVTMACTACHGMNAEGTDLAPALAGHSEFSVRRQVRAPMGIMPVYNPTMVPAADLDALVAYVTSLVPIEATESPEGTEAPEAHDHGHASLAPGDIVFAHHWLLYLALQDEDKVAAMHQAVHTFSYVTGDHLIKMQALLNSIASDDFAAALAVAETMVADVNVFGEDGDFVYLQMIYRAVVLEDAENSTHFITDYLEHMQAHENMGLIESVQAAVESGDFEAAAALLEAQYGDSLLFELVTHDDEHGEETEAGHDEHGEATEEAHDEHGEATEEATEVHSGH